MTPLKKSDLPKPVKASVSKAPRPDLPIIGTDGNVFNLLGIASRVARQNGMDWEAIKSEATSGDYDHVLSTFMKYFNVC